MYIYNFYIYNYITHCYIYVNQVIFIKLEIYVYNSSSSKVHVIYQQLLIYHLTFVMYQCSTCWLLQKNQLTELVCRYPAKKISKDC